MAKKMFETPITSLPLVGGLADDSFEGRIQAATFRQDVSMAAVARALFDKRLGPKETIKIDLTPMYYSSENNLRGVDEIARGLKSGMLHVVSVSARADDSGKWIDGVRESLKGSKLYELEALHHWFASTGTTAVVFTDKPYDPKIPRSPVDNTKTLVVLENMTIARWHLVTALLPRFLGKWFQAAPRTPEETKMINGLASEAPDAFVTAIHTYAEKYDFRGVAIHNKLKDFEVKFAKTKVKALEEKCQVYDRQVKELSTRLGRILKEKEDTLAMLFGYQNQAEKGVEPLTMNYFLANKNLFLQNATADYLDFYDVAWFTNWDPDKAEATFAKGHCSSWLEYNTKFGVSDEDAKLLYKAMFLDETIRVRLWSHINLYLRGDDPMNICDGSECISDIQNALPNPHHQYNDCGGSNRSYVAQCIADRDIVGAIEQCVSATGGINLTEHASYQYFCRDLFDPQFGKVIYIKETGKFETTKDAIAWLKEKQNGQKAEAKTEAQEAK